MSDELSVIVNNKKARHEYFIEAVYECGIALVGTEVKSLRRGKASLKESYAGIKDGEIFLYQMNISPYEQGSYNNVDPLRPRKLLMHKQEIRKLIGLQQREGYTLVPLKLYFTRGKVKVELALAKGKKLYDKRHVLAEKDAHRKMQQTLRR